MKLPFVLLLSLLLLSHGGAARVSAQVVAPIETPYTLIDADTRTRLQVGAEGPLRGNGPPTGYAYLFLTWPQFLHESLTLRAAISPVYATGELIRNHSPTRNSALGFGLGGGLYAASHVEFRNGRFREGESFSGDTAEATFAYYQRGRKIAGVLPIELQFRARPMYVTYARNDETSRRFRLPEDSAIYVSRAGIRVGGVPPRLFPESAVELSLWHRLRYREHAGRYGLPDRPRRTEHLTQETWLRLGGIHPIGSAQASAFMNAGLAGDSDALSAFRLGGSLRLRGEFPLMLQGYNLDEVLARRFWLLNLAYRFPAWPGQERVHVQILADHARVAFLPGYRLPRSGLTGVGANLSVALTERTTLVAGYGHGIDAPRRGGFGGHGVQTLLEYRHR